MSKDTENLLDAARRVQPTEADKEEHRRSFAFGNTNIENARITRELIDRQADQLRQDRPTQAQMRVSR